MSSLSDPVSRLVVTDLVQLIAAGTGLTTIARFGQQDSPLPVALVQQFMPRTSSDEQNPNYGGLLRVVAEQERDEPSRLRPLAVALILPERDIAYLRFATGPLTVLPVGRNPHDEPATREAVGDGLKALLQAIDDNRPPPRPAGQPFAAEPSSPPPLRSPSWPPDPGSGHRHGPHR